MSNAAPPEQGQLVDVRQRHYVITDVEASTLSANSLRLASPPQHFVTSFAVPDEPLVEDLPMMGFAAVREYQDGAP